MKRFTLTVYATVFLGCFFGKAQVILQASTPPTPAAIATSPAGISQFEVRNKLITQDSFFGLGIIPAAQQTGGFGTSARWNSMGSLNAGTQVLNGFRTQTNGRGLTTGYSIVGINVSNPTIQWIGNAEVGATPGSLDFKYANSPGSPGFPQPDVTMFRLAPQGGTSFLPFAHATQGALLGQLEVGSLGNFNPGNIWSATGVVNTPSFVTYGTRHQYNGYTLNSGLISDLTNQTTAILDFGNNSPAGVGSYVFKFRSFSDPVNPGSIKNIWQSSTKFNNIVLGRQDYFNVNSQPYYMSLFDGQNSVAGPVATNFIERAGIYATTDGNDENGTLLNSYAALVGDVSAAVNTSNRIGVLGISDDDANFPGAGNKWAGYFAGSVVITGSLVTPSDKKFKTNINDEQNMLAKIMQLKPKNYLFDTKENRNMAFSNKLQHGLISQEVEVVFPELVQDIYGPSSSSNPKENGKPMIYKGINYNGLIPILLQGIREQQAQIEELKTLINSSKTLVINDRLNLPAEIENKAFSLSQNVPNPFSERTTISYSIPTNVTKAVLAVFDLNGRMLQQYALLQGKNQLTINGNSYGAGMYIYSLIADGQEVVSKRMILTK